jgi:hypothetical protein
MILGDLLLVLLHVGFFMQASYFGGIVEYAFLGLEWGCGMLRIGCFLVRFWILIT